jgi:soluble lytic murein transglycosylase-like protein
LLVLLASASALALTIHAHYAAGLKLHGAPTPRLAEDSATFGEVSADSATHREYERDRAISAFLAKRYRVSEQVTQEFVRTAFRVGQGIGIDPLLIIAVIAVESRFNPIAESVAGAKGLMQIIPRFHADKLEEFGGEQAIFEPHANIVVGARILREYIHRMGDVVLGLKVYGGEPLEGENSYPDRVLDEKRRLQQVVGQHDRASRARPPRTQVAL